MIWKISKISNENHHENLQNLQPFFAFWRKKKMGANIGFAPSMGIWEIGKDVFPKICWLRERLLAFSGSQLCAKKASPPIRGVSVS